jgi:predicted nucleotidyltransferase
MPDDVRDDAERCALLLEQVPASDAPTSARAETSSDDAMTIDMRGEWLVAIRAWAERTKAVKEVWLFGSRAHGDATDDSDIDLAIALMPREGRTDWALSDYTRLGDDWQRELARLVGRHVSLEAVRPNSDPEKDDMVRGNWHCLWARAQNSVSGQKLRMRSICASTVARKESTRWRRQMTRMRRIWDRRRTDTP